MKWYLLYQTYTVCLKLLVGIWIVACFTIIMLLCTFTHRSLCRHMSSLLLKKLVGVGLLNHMLGKSFILQEMSSFPTWLYYFAFFFFKLYSIYVNSKKNHPLLSTSIYLTLFIHSLWTLKMFPYHCYYK